MSKILITGAAGFIGRRLAARLLKEGADLRCLLHGSTPAPAALRGAELVRGDLLDRNSLKAAMADVSAVYHCAALVRPAGLAVSAAGLERDFFSVNRDGTFNAARAAAAAGAKVFLHLSSISAQGPGLGLTEDAPCRPLTLYGRSKLASEAAAAAGIMAGAACRLTICRPAMIYGKDSPSWGKFFAAVKSGLVPVPGSGRNTLSVCWAESLVDALLLLAEKGGDREIYNISEGPRSWEELAGLAAAGLGVRARLLRVPALPLRALSSLSGSALGAAGLAMPRFNYLTEPGAFREALSGWQHDTAKLRALGWTPRLSTGEALRRLPAGSPDFIAGL